MVIDNPIKQPIYYTVIYQRRLGKYENYLRHHIGCYQDIRDAIQAIVTAYRKNPSFVGEFLIDESRIKPRYGLLSTRYKDG